MKALYLEKKGILKIGEYQEKRSLQDDDAVVAISKVGICGSDIHYYTHGRIGPYVVEKPMVLGHEAAGIVVATGKKVQHLQAGDRVCMEPGIPRFNSRTSMEGYYNLDPDLTFWATPPVDGCLRETVIHPAALTFKLPDNLTLAEGAMVEPLSIGVQTATRATLQPGDCALVTGAGTIGIVSALALLACGCAKVVISDISAQKLKIAASYDGLITVDANQMPLDVVKQRYSGNRGFDVVVEASGAAQLYPQIVDSCATGGRLLMVGIPGDPVLIDVTAVQSREVDIRGVFRYRGVYQRTIDLLAAGKIDVKRLIGREFSFADSIAAYQYVAGGGAGEIKVMISLS